MMLDTAMGKSSINTLGQTKAACQYEIHTISQCYTQPEGKAAKLKPNLKSHLTVVQSPSQVSFQTNSTVLPL